MNPVISNPQSSGGRPPSAALSFPDHLPEQSKTGLLSHFYHADKKAITHLTHVFSVMRTGPSKNWSVHNYTYIYVELWTYIVDLGLRSRCNK